MRVQGFTVTRLGSERGIALITTLLVMMLMSALLVGFTTVVMSDQRYRLIDRDRVRSFYAAQSGLEKLNVDLTNLFLNNVAPTAAQIASLKDNPPVIPDVTFVADGSSAAYGVTEEPPPFGCPNPCSLTISTGPYAGLIALKKVYRLDATARTADGGETHLVRKVETVAIPVFQFGMFSDMDLSFHAGPTFDFGGRVHTNGNLFLAQGDGNTLWLREKVTALKEVVRKRLANGVDIPTSNHEGVVKMATAPGAFRNLLDSEGSVQDMPPTPLNTSWPSISLGSYNSYIRNGLTGAKPLNLPLLTTGGTNADLIRRPAANEASTNPDLLHSRYFNNVSLRILLSDRAADIMSLPTIVQSSQPVSLDGNWRTSPPAGYNGATGVDATHAPVARSPGNVLVGGNLPQVIGTTGAAPNMTISVKDPAGAGVPLLPRGYRVQSTAASQYYAMTVTSGANAYQVTCSGRTTVAPLQFTGCITSPTPAIAVPLGATVTAVLNNDTVVSTTIAGLAWAAPFTTLRVNATAAFQPNTFAVTVTRAGQAGSPWTVHCSGKTATTLTGCIPQTVPAATVNSAGATVRANVATVDGNLDVPVATQQGLGANWAAPWTTITLSGTASMAYSTNTFWVLNGNGSNALVTCTGYTMPNTLTGCNVSTGGTVTANAQISSAALSNAGTGLIGGFIKIEMQDANKQWRDVTLEVLSYGIAAPNQVGKICDPSPNAIIRLQRLRDNAESGAGCPSYQGTMMTTDFIPNTLFDAREALYRDPAVAPPATDPPLLGGVIHYVTIDVRNLSDWLEGIGAYAAGSGSQALNNEGRGFSVYFSDRRNNRNTVGQETGDYGFEDIINPNSANGDPSGGLPDPGEDVNASGGNVETYGEIPAYYDATGVFSSQPPGAVAPLTSAARTRTPVRAPFAMVNRAILFRRALKLTNGGLGNIIMPGLTVSAENPVYIHGNWNANSSAANEGALGEPNAATSIVADALTLLSDNWSDWNSFRFPYAPGSRGRTNDSYYRLGVIAGKNKSFDRPTVGTTPTDFGSDGGAHNFLRMLEGGGQSVHYRGSIASFFYSRQAVGVYKCCQAVYGAPPGPGSGVPGRNFAFDTDFLDPSLLPPLTPVFRDTNALGFAQEVRPGK
jgi:hypothetical protein